MKSRDQVLIDECLAGQVDAFEELIRPYVDRLHNTLYRLTGQYEEASELLQDTMVRAFRGLRSFHGDSSFYTWLYRIALNVVLSSRRRQRLRVADGSVPGEPGRFDPADRVERTHPGLRLELEERREVVQQALDQVPDPFRTVLVLKDIEDLKYEEIAELLDVPIGTVRSRLHRARSEMRHLLKPMLDRGAL